MNAWNGAGAHGTVRGVSYGGTQASTNFSKRSPSNSDAYSGTECCEPQGQHADWPCQPETRKRATRPNVASAIDHSPQLSNSHKPALDTAGSATHGQGVPGATTIHALRNPRRGVQRPHTCLSHPRPVAHNRPSTWIRFAAAAGVPCGLNTTHFRAGEPSRPMQTQTFWSSQEPHTC